MLLGDNYKATPITMNLHPKMQKPRVNKPDEKLCPELPHPWAT